MTLLPEFMSKRRKQWPPIYRVENRSGNPSFQVALGLVDGKRKRLSFPTLQEAQTFAEQARTKKANEGMMAFSLSREVSLDATKASAILAPYGITIFEAATYYKNHVLAYKSAPLVKEVIAKYLSQSEQNNDRPRTLSDKRSRLNSFAEDFGEVRLSEVSLDQLKDWIADEEWEPRTRINYLTKVSQLYNYAVRENWVDANITEKITRPKTDEIQPEIFTVNEAERLLSHSGKFGLLPYFALGLFAGVRSAELMRLKTSAVKFSEKSIVIGPSVAKKRAQRVIDMTDALLAWLEPCREQLEKTDGPIVDAAKFRWNKEQLLEAAEIKEWKHNGLRHSFGSYHLAAFQNAQETSHQMGNSPNVVHKHYKALVSKSEAENFWALRPQAQAAQ
jgi:integrase